MKKGYFFFLIVLFFSSCGAEYGIPTVTVNENDSSYSEVQKIFYSFAEYLNANQTTKSENLYEVTSVESLSIGTKSNDAGELFEIKFENKQNGEQGFSLVGITNYFSDVLAFVPQGELRDTLFNEGLKAYYTSLRNVLFSKRVETKDAGVNMVGDCFYEPDLSRSRVVRRLTFEEAFAIGQQSPCAYDTTITYYYRTAEIVTKWNQNRPYNKKVPYKDRDGVTSSVGCVAVAMGQAMSYYKYPLVYDWDLLLQKSTVSPGETERAEIVSTLLYDAALSVYTEWNMSGAGMAYLSDVVEGLKSFGYSSEYKAYGKTINRLIDYWGILSDCCAPIIMSGTGVSQSGKSVCHAWVIDGALKQEKWYCETLAETQNNGEVTYYLKIFPVYGYLTRCNWGWGGVDDGWYHEFKMDFIGYSYTGQKEMIYNIKPNL